MRAEVQKIFILYEELVEAGNNATLMFSSKGGKSTIKLQLESPSPSPLTATTTTLPPAPGRRRRHLLQGLVVDSEQQTIRLPLLRRPPVFRWFLHVALSTSFPPRLLLLGGDE